MSSDTYVTCVHSRCGKPIQIHSEGNTPYVKIEGSRKLACNPTCRDAFLAEIRTAPTTPIPVSTGAPAPAANDAR